MVLKEYDVIVAPFLASIETVSIKKYPGCKTEFCGTMKFISKTYDLGRQQLTTATTVVMILKVTT